MVSTTTYYLICYIKKPNRVKTLNFGAALPLFLCMAFKSVQGRGLRRRPAGGPGAAAEGCGASVFYVFSLEKCFKNMCELLNNAPDQGPAATGVTKNLYIIVMFHTFWIGMDPKHTYYYKFLNILKLDHYNIYILL